MFDIFRMYEFKVLYFFLGNKRIRAKWADYAIQREIPFVKIIIMMMSKTKKKIKFKCNWSPFHSEPENEYMTDNEAGLVKMFHWSIEQKN